MLLADLQAFRAAKALAAQRDMVRSGLQADVSSHDITALSAAIKEAKSARKTKGKSNQFPNKRSTTNPDPCDNGGSGPL